MFVSRGNKLWITTLCPYLRTWCWTAGAPTVPCPYTKYLGSVRNKGAENIGLDENRGIGKECRYKTMEQRTGGNSQENVFGWTTKCTDLFFRVACLAVWDAICLFSCTVTTLVLTSRTTHRLIFLFRQHNTATCLTHGSERLPRASAQKMSSAWMFLIRWNQYYQTSFPMKHYSPFPCSERLEGKEYHRNCVPTKIPHQTCEPNAALAVLNLMSLVKMKPCHCYKPWQV